jgi:diguanylate cyclase (GGDEF)-like protein/PAS domain S-box-containing protein
VLDFLKSQTDYMLFLEGLAILALGIVCHFVLEKGKNQKLPWAWLGWFGIIYGTVKWGYLVGFALGNQHLVSVTRVTASTAAFFLLIEFARAGSAGWKPGRWIYIPLLALVLLGNNFSRTELELASILIPAAAGGLWSAMIIWQSSKTENRLRRSLNLLAVSLVAFTIISTISPSFDSLKFFTTGANPTFSGITVLLHLLSDFLAVTVLAAVWSYAKTPVKIATPIKVDDEISKKLARITWALSFVILLLGWVGTEALGRLADVELRQNMLSRAALAATAIDPERVVRLTVSPEDTGKADFEYLRSHLAAIHAANHPCRYTYLLGLKDGRVVFLADAEPVDSPDYSPPGQEYYEASEKLIASFTDGKAFIEGPMADRWGIWVSSLAPIIDSVDGHVIALLGMDISAVDWPFKIAAYRLSTISATLILLLTSLFFSSILFNKEIALRSAASEKRFRTIFESAAEGIIIFEIETGRILHFNPFVSKWLGYEYRDENLDLTVDDLFGIWIKDIQEEIIKSPDPHFGQITEVQCHKKDGTPVDAAVTGTFLKFREKDCILIFVRDESERKRAEEALLESEERYRVLFNSGKDAILVHRLTERGMQENFIEVNGVACERLCYSRKELLRLSPADIEVPGKHEIQVIIAKLNTEKHVLYEAVHVSKSGRKIPVEVNAQLFELGGYPTVLSIARDIYERKQIEEQLQYLATHDSLTNIPNRYSLQENLKRVVAKANRGENSALLLIDLDNFKLVNDSLGHAAGDELLITLVGILRNNLREGDLLARLGGDEFVVLLEGAKATEAELVAEKLRRVIDEEEIPLVMHGASFNLSISIGIIMIDGTLDYRKLLSHADTALYTAKDEGRNRIIMVKPDENATSGFSETNRLVSTIKRALKEDNFILLFQPVVSISEGFIKHYETLLRMRDESGKLIDPNNFIPTAERFGLMPQIDLWVVQSSLKILKVQSDLNLFVNISGNSLGDETFLNIIEASIRNSAIDPSRIGFEITETVVIKNLSRAKQWFRRLKSMGCSFALDDFGTGFSSFSYLRMLPVDYIKIDGAYARDLDSEQTHRALIQAMNTVAHTLGKKTVVEFIETENDLKVLQGMDIDYGQGYYLGRPSPLPEDLKQT